MQPYVEGRVGCSVASCPEQKYKGLRSVVKVGQKERRGQEKGSVAAMNLGYIKVGNSALAIIKYQVQEFYEILATWISGDEFSCFLTCFTGIISSFFSTMKIAVVKVIVILFISPAAALPSLFYMYLDNISLFTLGKKKKKVPTSVQSFSLNHLFFFLWVTDPHDSVWTFLPSVHFPMQQVIPQNFISTQGAVHPRQLNSKDVWKIGSQIPFPYTECKPDGESIEVGDQSP